MGFSIGAPDAPKRGEATMTEEYEIDDGLESDESTDADADLGDG
jgi:hypothetical protein